MKKGKLLSLLILTVLKFNTISAQQYIFSTYDMGNTPAFTTNVFKAADVDTSGRIWIGSTKMGLYYCDSVSWFKAGVLQTNDIRQLTADPTNGTIWAAQSGTGTSSGSTNIAGGLTNVFSPTSSFNWGPLYYPGALPSLPTRAAMGVTVFPNGDVFSSHGSQTTGSSQIMGGALGSLPYYDTIGHRIFAGIPYQGGTYTGSNTVPYYEQMLTGIANNGSELWVNIIRACDNGNCTENFINRYSSTGALLGSFTSSNSPIPFNNTTSTPTAKAIFFDNAGRAWIGLSSGGIYIYDQGTWIHKDETNSLFPVGASVNFHSITQDSRGDVFVGTTAGLMQYSSYDLSSPASYNQLFSTSNGLPSAYVAGITVDKQNNKWLATSAGIVKMKNAPDSSITGNIKDVIVLFSSGTLAFNNCSGAVVELYQGTTLITQQTTTSTGLFSFTGLTGSNYKVVATKTINSVTASVTHDNVSPGDLLTDVKIPCSLIIQTNNIVDSLQSKVFTANLFYNSISFNFPTTGYNESAIVNYINGAKDIQSDYEDVVNSLSRLFIAQKALDEYSDDAAVMISETVVSAYDLGEIIYNFVTVSRKVPSIPNLDHLAKIKKINSLAKSATLKTIKLVVLQGLNYIEDASLRTLTKDKLSGIMAAIADHAEAKDPDAFNAVVSKKFVKNLITTGVSPFLYSKAYVPITLSNVNLAYTNANTNNYTGTFADAFDYVIDNSANNSLVESNHLKTNLSKSLISSLRTTGDLVSIISDVAGVAALATTLVDGGAMLSISKSLALVKTGTVVASMGTGIYRLYKIKNELPDATTNSFLKSVNFATPYNQQLLDSRSLSLSTAISDYNNYLLAIENDIIGNQREIAIGKMDSLLILDSVLFDAQINALTPIYAAAPYANSTISNFDSLYTNTVINSAGRSMFSRQALNFNLISYLMDSTSTSIIDSLSSQAASAISSNTQMETDINNMTDSISTVSVPAHIFVTSSNVPKPMVQSTSYPVSFSYTNIGTIDATDVFARLTLIDGFTTTQDSVFVGTVISGATGNVTFNIQSPAFDTISYLTVVFNSPNTTSDGTGTSLVVKTPPIITSAGFITEYSTFSIYPNPFSQQTTVSFKQQQKNTSVKIMDVLGKCVKTINFTGKELIIEKGDLSKGIYFVQVRDEHNNLANKKIVVQ